MLIACDVDDLIADLWGTWLPRYNREYGDTLTLDRITGWELEPLVRPECGAAIYKYLNDPDLYEHVGVVEGAVEGVAALRAAGHHVFFATSCTEATLPQKMDWLQRYGFVKPPLKGLLPQGVCVCPTEGKALYLKADLILDDAPGTIRDWVLGTPPRRAIVYDRPYNQDATLGLHSFQWWGWCRRASNWAEIVEHVANWNQ